MHICVSPETALIESDGIGKHDLIVPREEKHFDATTLVAERGGIRL
jgi:hypothetical protein